MKEALLGRLGKVGSKAASSIASMREEIASLTLQQLEQLVRRLNLTRRDEFENLQAMVNEMLAGQQDIRTRLSKLEGAKGVNSSLRTKSAGKKTPAKSRAKQTAKHPRK